MVFRKGKLGNREKIEGDFKGWKVKKGMGI